MLDESPSNLSFKSSDMPPIQAPQQSPACPPLYEDSPFIMGYFPLSASKLGRICCSYRLAGCPVPLNALTGEVQRLGFFYPIFLHYECKLVLPETLGFNDYPLLQQRAMFFEWNQPMFQCQSIGLALRVILNECRQYWT